MINLYEIFLRAQDGQAIDNLAKKFDLSAAQTQAAIEALLPAFTLGLRRQASQPGQMPDLFAMLAGGNPQAFENPFTAFSQQAAQQGEEFLRSLFGPQEVSRAIAEQAATMSGVGAGILRAMLPFLAAILMGGLSKSASQPSVQDMMSRMMGGMAGRHPADPFGMFSGPQPQVQPNANGGGLLGALLGSLLQQGAQQSGGAKPSGAGPGEEAKPGDMFDQLFATGRQVQQAQIEAFQSIFDAVLPKPDEGKKKKR
jgi:hypothetical protein